MFIQQHPQKIEIRYVCLLSTITKVISSSRANIGQSFLLAIIKYWCFLSLGLPSYNATHWMCKHHLALVMLPCGNRRLENLLKKMLTFWTSFLDRLIHQRADSRSKKNYNPTACGRKTTFTER